MKLLWNPSKLFTAFMITFFASACGGGSSSAPVSTTQAATSVTTSGAVLNGTVNPSGLATTTHFEWGLDDQLVVATSTAGQSIGSGRSGVAVNAALTGLVDNTTYYYRAVGTNSAGTSRGVMRSFTTMANVCTVNTLVGRFEEHLLFRNYELVQRVKGDGVGSTSATWVGAPGKFTSIVFVLSSPHAVYEPIGNNVWSLSAGATLNIGNILFGDEVSGWGCYNITGDGFNASYEEPQNTWTNWLYNVVVAAGSTFPDYLPGTYQRAYTFTQIQNRVYLTPPYPDLTNLPGCINGPNLVVEDGRSDGTGYWFSYYQMSATVTGNTVTGTEHVTRYALPGGGESYVLDSTFIGSWRN